MIEINGKAITGWRGWTVGAVAIIAAGAILAAVAFLFLGIAAGVISFLVIVAPAIVIVTLVAWTLQPRGT